MTVASSKPSPSLSFDPETHIYTLDGRVLPSVTQIINAVLPGWKATDWHLGRGLATHYGCELLDKGTLIRSSIAPEIELRIHAWEKFRADYVQGKPIAIERRLAHSVYKFAGTLDRVFDADPHITVIDLKNSVSEQVRLQLGAYSLLWADTEKRLITRAAAVELKDDGTYRTLWLNKSELRRAEQTFLAALTVFNFAKTHNLKLQGDSHD